MPEARGHAAEAVLFQLEDVIGMIERIANETQLHWKILGSIRD